MAKGNMLQGMARGKVGDIVFSRLNGEQISRVRNRNPKNPRTNAQLYQRAIMATVMQAYSAGKEIFDHSFQGKSVGAANQRRFMSLNAKKLREMIANDLKNYDLGTITDSDAKVVAPGSVSPVPNKLQVSEGTLTNTLFVLNNEGIYIVADKLTNEKVGEYCTRLGLTENDLFTFVAFVSTSNDPIFVTPGYDGVQIPSVAQFPCEFRFVRYSVKSTALTSNETLTSLNQILEISDYNVTPDYDVQGTPGQRINSRDVYNDNYGVSYGYIRSKIDQDLRSSCDMLLMSSSMTGISSIVALEAWKSGTVAVGDSDLILEGGEGREYVPTGGGDGD